MAAQSDSTENRSICPGLLSGDVGGRPIASLSPLRNYTHCSTRLYPPVMFVGLQTTVSIDISTINHSEIGVMCTNLADYRYITYKYL